MRVDLLTREYPPHVYGGAGVHVAGLTAVLRELVDVRVHAFDEPVAEPGTHGYAVPEGLAGANAALATMGVDLAIVDGIGHDTADGGTDLVHSHTWYANLAGHLASLLYDVPHVLTAHSLEPLRPWKAEQLGGGYALSSWVERTAYEAADAVIAVSGGMREDILRSYPAVDPATVHVVHNGIDLDGWRRPTSDEGLAHARRVVQDLGIDPDRPAVVFVGRITRQKGLPYLLRAVEALPADVQVVLCAGAPDTPEIAEEIASAVQQLSQSRTGVFWVREMLPQPKIDEILSAATVFVCPSVYEPLGIVNLEAMACATAVVASDVGGIPEVVADQQTGLLVHYDAEATETFERDLAEAVNALVADPQRAGRYGLAGRQRCIDHFSWARIAEQTVQIYRTVSA